MTTAIDVVGLRREWPVAGGPPVVAVHGATFSVAQGEVFGLLGPNGAGKTTLMQMLATLSTPTAGTARVAGHDIRTASVAVRASLGYLSTTSGLPARLTVRECLGLFADLQGLRSPQAAVTRMVDRMRLGAFVDRRVETLSTGMRQRARIACAAIHRPAVLILDEPTAGLDLMSTDDLLDEVRSLRDEGASVLYSTHAMDEADRVCDRVAILHEGALRAIGTPVELLARTSTATLAAAFRAIVRA